MDMLNKNMIMIRSSLNYSQRQFADLAGVASSTVSAWELGNSIPRIKALTRISERLGVSIDDLKNKELSAKDVNCPPISFPADMFAAIMPSEAENAGDMPDDPNIYFDAVNLFDVNNEAEIKTLTNACKRLPADDILALVNIARHLDHVRYKTLDDFIEEKLKDEGKG